MQILRHGASRSFQDSSQSQLRSAILSTAILCTAILWTVISAQEPNSNRGGVTQHPRVSQETDAATQNTVTPPPIAACLALDNQEEVILSKFAIGKAKNREVSDFATMIAEEHQACLEKLIRFAPEASSEGFLSDNAATTSNLRSDSETVASGTSIASGAAKTSRTSPLTAGDNAGIDMMQLQREMALRMTTSMIANVTLQGGPLDGDDEVGTPC